MQNDSRNRRRNYFIDKSFQSKFIVKFCLLITAASLLTGFLTYMLNKKTTTVAFENLRVVVKTTADFLLPVIIYIFLIVTFLVGIATVIITLFTSHKISGPLYRIKICVDKMKQGDLTTPFKIRTKDQLQVIATDFEEFRVDLKDSVKKLKSNWRSIKNKLNADGKIDTETEKIIKDIDSKLDSFKTD